MDSDVRQTQDDAPGSSATDRPLEELEPWLGALRDEDIVFPNNIDSHNGTPEVHVSTAKDSSESFHTAPSLRSGFARPSAAPSTIIARHDASSNKAEDKHLDGTQVFHEPHDPIEETRKGKEPLRPSSDTTAGHTAKPHVTFSLEDHNSDSDSEEVVWRGWMKRERAATAPQPNSNEVAQPVVRRRVHRPSQYASYQQLPAIQYSPVPYYGYYPQHHPFGLQFPLPYAPMNALAFLPTHPPAYYPLQSNVVPYLAQPRSLSGPTRPGLHGIPAENTDGIHVKRAKTKVMRVAKSKRPKVKIVKRIKQTGESIPEAVKSMESEASKKEYTGSHQRDRHATVSIDSDEHNATPLADISRSPNAPEAKRIWTLDTTTGAWVKSPSRSSSVRDGKSSATPPFAPKARQEPMTSDARSIYQLGANGASSTPAFATWRKGDFATSLSTHKAILRGLPPLHIPGTLEPGTKNLNSDLDIGSASGEPSTTCTNIYSPRIVPASKEIKYQVDENVDAQAEPEGLIVSVAVQCSHATLYSRFSTLLHSNWPERSAPNSYGSIFVKRAVHAKRMKKRDGSHSIELSCNNGPSSNGEPTKFSIQWL
jgi:hypothetical protein